MREPEPKTKQAPPGVLLETTLKTRNQNRIRVLGSLYYNVIQINWSETKNYRPPVHGLGYFLFRLIRVDVYNPI